MHVPFCARSCAYCRFYKKFPSPSDIDSYLAGVESEVGQFRRENPEAEFSSVFFGGGTPTCLSESHLERLCAAFSECAGRVEWTCEAAPGTVRRKKLEVMRSFGINRLSLGVQSFDAATLARLGRPHPPNAAPAALEEALETFENVNIDLIFGAEGQTRGEWLSDLARAAASGVKHVSAYCLEFESGTSCCAGASKEISIQESEAEFLGDAVATLAAAGYRHYEISNYAIPGWECEHNINTWRMGCWVGFGPAAASQFGGLRRRNPADIGRWLKSVAGPERLWEDVVRLDDGEMLSSSLIFGLRMRSGVSLPTLGARFPNADISKYAPAISELVREGMLEESGGTLRITEKGVPLADAIAVELL